MVTPSGGIYHHSWRAADHAAKRTSLPAKQPGASQIDACKIDDVLLLRSNLHVKWPLSFSLH